MTETYHGPWNSVTGDKPERKVADDPYHPRYPAVSEIAKIGYSQATKVEQSVSQPG